MRVTADRHSPIRGAHTKSTAIPAGTGRTLHRNSATSAQPGRCSVPVTGSNMDCSSATPSQRRQRLSKSSLKQMDASRLWVQVKGTRNLQRYTRRNGCLRYSVPMGHAIRWLRSADPTPAASRLRRARDPRLGGARGPAGSDLLRGPDGSADRSAAAGRACPAFMRKRYSPVDGPDDGCTPRRRGSRWWRFYVLRCHGRWALLSPLDIVAVGVGLSGMMGPGCAAMSDAVR